MNTVRVSPALRDRLAERLRAVQPTADTCLGEEWLDPKGRFVSSAGGLFGADIGGTKVQSIVTDLNGTVLAEIRASTPVEGGNALLAMVADHKAQLAAQAGVEIRAAGIGLPGALHPVTRHLERAPNLGGLDGCDMREVFCTALGVPVAVENDVNLAALGETWLGHGAVRDMRAGGLAFVALGTGIGMGVCWGDRILRGALGAAGEIAVLPIGADPFSTSSHACGALESVVSGAALVADYRASGGKHHGQTFRDVSKQEAGDPVLDAVMERLAKHVALAVLSVDAVVNPALFVFGGGIGSQPELLDRIHDTLGGLLPEGMSEPECRVSVLGNRAGVLGAIRAARLAYADWLLE